MVDAEAIRRELVHAFPNGHVEAEDSTGTSDHFAVVVVSVFYFIIFNIEGSILVPTFEGRMISFSGATVLVLITIGFALGGIIGAIVALPVAAIVRDIFSLIFRHAQVMAGVPPVREADDPPATVGAPTPEAEVGPAAAG